MKLASILPLEAVFPHFEARDKKQAIRELSSEASAVSQLPEKEIFSVLMQREQAGCTGMGNGVCIPHGRFKDLKGLHAFFAKLEKPIDFGSADGKPVDLIFLLLTPSEANTEHMKALASISRLLRDRALCDKLRKAPDTKTIHRLLTSQTGDDVAGSA